MIIFSALSLALISTYLVVVINNSQCSLFSSFYAINEGSNSWYGLEYVDDPFKEIERKV
jgi:hypothetical protein